MTNLERRQAEILLPEAISAATQMADMTISSLKARIRDLRELDTARHDDLTGLWEDGYWKRLVQPHIDRVQALNPEVADNAPNAALIVFLDAEDMHFINNELGWFVGNQAILNGKEGLKAFAEFIQGASRSHERRAKPTRPVADTHHPERRTNLTVQSENSRRHDLLGRLGGDELGGFFLINIGPDNSLENVARKITERLKKGMPRKPGELPLISWGYTFVLPGETKSLEDYIHEADPKLHMTDEEKQQRAERKQKRLETGVY